MPTQSTTYNSRVTDEALEKRFRDTFRAQGGAELVDDLYAQGVIVPVVDFTAAATGDTLDQNLQTAWDFSTGYIETQSTTSTVVSNSGFWLCQVNIDLKGSGAGTESAQLQITDGISTKPIWSIVSRAADNSVIQDQLVVFLRSGDSLTQTASTADVVIRTTYRQIATVDGDLVNPTGFTSS